MTYDAINELIVVANSLEHGMFWKYDAGFFMLFYDRFKNTLFTDIMDFVFMYVEISNWQGMSARCAGWQ